MKALSSNVQSSLYEGAIFVVIVLFLFLANTRTTVISLVTLPLSLVVTILVLHYMGLSINTMSLGGMAIAIGSLVDDAIVDVENVWKHLRANHALPQAERRSVVDVVFHALREVRMPILNSTLIIVVSFVPLFFLTGMEGRMLIPLGIAFIVSLFASTVVALTLLLYCVAICWAATSRMKVCLRKRSLADSLAPQVLRGCADVGIVAQASGAGFRPLRHFCWLSVRSLLWEAASCRRSTKVHSLST